MECEPARVEPGKKNRFHVVWLSGLFGVKTMFTRNAEIWIVLSRRIGSKIRLTAVCAVVEPFAPSLHTLYQKTRASVNAPRMGMGQLIAYC